MLNLITCRETGQLPRTFLQRAEATRRTHSIQLGESKTMEQVFSSGVNSLDLEKEENRYLLASGSQGKVVIYDVENTYGKMDFTCEPVAAMERSFTGAHKFSVETVQWYPHDTGMFLTSSGDKSLKVWDTNSLQVAEEFNFNGYVYCHNMSRIARKHCLVAVAVEDSRVKLCDLKSGSSTHILKGHKAAVMSVMWSPRSEYILASGSRDNRILLWDVRKARSCLMTLDQHNGKGAGSFRSSITAHNGHVNGLCYTSDGLHLLSIGTDDRMRLWDLLAESNTLINYGKVFNPSRKNTQFCVSKGLSSELVFAPSGNDIFMFEIHTGKKISTLIGHYNNVNCCIFDSFSQELYSGGNDTHVLSWSPKTHSDESQEKDDKTDEKKKTNTGYQDSWSSDEGD